MGTESDKIPYRPLGPFRRSPKYFKNTCYSITIHRKNHKSETTNITTKILEATFQN